MSLLAVVLCLLAQHTYPLAARGRLLASLGRASLWVSKQLDAGDRESGVVAWMALMAAIIVPAVLAVWILGWIHPFFLWLFDVAVLFLALRFIATVKWLASIQASLAAGHAGEAANALAQWKAEPVETDDAGAIARLAAEQALRESHQGAFALLFWFLVLPGPIGIFLYSAAQRAAQTWGPGAQLADAPADGAAVESPDFGWFAARAFHVLDWVPQRVSGFFFAIAGDFEDALYCWRMQARQWIRRDDEGIVLASGAGALGVRLGDPVALRGTLVERPALGTGEPAREEALASLEGLLWRSLGVWLIVYALAAALGAA